jgi:hypothetical protein
VPLRAIPRTPLSCESDIEADNPTGDMFIITDNLSSHNSLETRTWLADHPRLQHVFIPKGARLGSISKRVGGAFSVAMHSRARALPMLMRLNERCRWRPCSSTTGRTPGSGDDRPKRGVICVASFATAFEERSTRLA